MIRILITNAYSARNRGDGAIVFGMMRSLGRAFAARDLEITISSADHPADRECYPVPVVPSFHSLMARVPGRGVLQGLFFLGVLLPFSILGALGRRFLGLAIPLPGGLGPLLDAYARADLVVAAGGGYLYTTSRRRGTVMLLVHLHSFVLGRVLGKPVYLYAQSIGPFASPFQTRLVRSALRHARLVEVREACSLQFLTVLNLPVPVHEAADAAFLLEPTEASPNPLAPNQKGLRVGVTVRRWFREPGIQERYEEVVARFLRLLAEAHDAEVIFLPQVSVTSRGDDDRETARRILRRLDGTVDARLLDAEPSPQELQWICGQMDLVVGTRMHSNIFALTMGVPVAAIAYQPKTLGIMEQLGLADFVLPMEHLDAHALLDLVERLLSDRSAIRQSLASALREVRRDAWRAGRLIAEDWRGNHPRDLRKDPA